MFFIIARVFLEIYLHFGNNFWMYLIDLLAMNFVSWITIIVGIVCLCCIKSWILGSVVFNDVEFNVIM